jgi:hypothetical protein
LFFATIVFAQWFSGSHTTKSFACVPHLHMLSFWSTPFVFPHVGSGGQSVGSVMHVGAAVVVHILLTLVKHFR